MKLFSFVLVFSIFTAAAAQAQSFAGAWKGKGTFWPWTTGYHEKYTCDINLNIEQSTTGFAIRGDATCDHGRTLRWDGWNAWSIKNGDLYDKDGIKVGVLKNNYVNLQYKYLSGPDKGLITHQFYKLLLMADGTLQFNGEETVFENDDRTLRGGEGIQFVLAR